MQGEEVENRPAGRRAAKYGAHELSHWLAPRAREREQRGISLMKTAGSGMAAFQRA